MEQFYENIRVELIVKKLTLAFAFQLNKIESKSPLSI